jgi:mono/diheme cytochrome c family protein
MRLRPAGVCVVLLLAGASGNAAAQDAANGDRLARRLCSECHATGSAPARRQRAPSWAVIAARPDASADMIAAFLLLPHATMPNTSLSRSDADDLAASIMATRK